MRNLTEREIQDNLRIDKLNRRLKTLCNYMETDHDRIDILQKLVEQQNKELSKSKAAQNKVLIIGIGLLIVSILATGVM